MATNTEASMATQVVGCDCGAWSGERCQWSGSVADTVRVRFVPDHHRGTATSAGTRRGVEQEIRVERSCAGRMVDTDGEWCEVVS